MARIITPESIKRLRDLNGWSQAKLAGELHVSQGTVSKMQNGQLPIDGPVVPLIERMLIEAEVKAQLA